jgi:hypothetical protein
MAKPPKIDESIRLRVLAALQAAEGATPEDQTEAVLRAIIPVVGHVAQRRRSESSMRAAFQEGFRTGQRAGRFSPWHSIIWTQSMIFRRIRAEREQPGLEEATSRYARFNDV